MTTLTVGGYTIGNLDQAAGVQAAAQAYTDNPTNSTLAAYDAALANAAAAITSLVTGKARRSQEMPLLQISQIW